jgi:hypothetical protein
MKAVKKLLGYILTGVGLLGFVYFENYKGETIPLPTIWLILSIVTGVIGAYLIVSAKMKNQIHKLNKNKFNVSRLKEKAEKIIINLDNCDFKEGSLSELNTENFSRIQMIDALYDPNRNYSDNKRTVTYIIYNHKISGAVEKFVSHPFSIDATTLKYYVSENKIVLYVDRFDRKQYFFDAE